MFALGFLFKNDEDIISQNTQEVKIKKYEYNYVI
jgi:hypothetical protein